MHIAIAIQQLLMSFWSVNMIFAALKDVGIKIYGPSWTLLSIVNACFMIANSHLNRAILEYIPIPYGWQFLTLLFVTL